MISCHFTGKGTTVHFHSDGMHRSGEITNGAVCFIQKICKVEDPAFPCHLKAQLVRRFVFEHLNLSVI